MSDEFSSTSVKIKKYQILENPKRDNPRNIDVNFSPSDYYNLDKLTKDKINVRNFCNILIHSFALIIEIDEDNKNDLTPDFSVFVNSDYSMDEFIFKFRMKDYFKIITQAFSDQILQWHIDYEKGINVKSNKPPDNSELADK